MSCEFCGKVLISRTTLKKHIEVMHQEFLEIKNGNKDHFKLEEAELIKLQTELPSMKFSDARKYIMSRIPLWQDLGILAKSRLAEGLLQFGWQLWGTDRPPTCNQMGTERLKKMFE